MLTVEAFAKAASTQRDMSEPDDGVGAPVNSRRFAIAIANWYARRLSKMAVMSDCMPRSDASSTWRSSRDKVCYSAGLKVVMAVETATMRRDCEDMIAYPGTGHHRLRG